jgi:hypothetical protein
MLPRVAWEYGHNVYPNSTSLELAQRPVRRTHLGGKGFWLLACREVTAFLDLVEIDELVIGTLGPTLWRSEDLARQLRRCRKVHNEES